jgi:hypothetical protein
VKSGSYANPVKTNSLISEDSPLKAYKIKKVYIKAVMRRYKIWAGPIYHPEFL